MATGRVVKVCATFLFIEGENADAPHVFLHSTEAR